MFKISPGHLLLYRWLDSDFVEYLELIARCLTKRQWRNLICISQSLLLYSLHFLDRFGLFSDVGGDYRSVVRSDWFVVWWGGEGRLKPVVAPGCAHTDVKHFRNTLWVIVGNKDFPEGSQNYLIWYFFCPDSPYFRRRSETFSIFFYFDWNINQQWLILISYLRSGSLSLPHIFWCQIKVLLNILNFFLNILL